VRFDAFSADYQLEVADRIAGPIHLQVGGKHNVINSLGAIAAALEAGLDVPTIAAGLAHFSLPDRRFQILYRDDTLMVVDDYAHHPTEVAVTLEMARRGPYRRVIAVFQPHRFTRLMNLLDEFPAAFKQADRVVVARLYAANQNEIPQISGQRLADELARFGHGDVHYIDDDQALMAWLDEQRQPGDAVIFLSAGNLTHTAHAYAARVQAERR
jgi:UDP-N-acetylmuramate--alanine ligase